MLVGTQSIASTWFWEWAEQQDYGDTTAAAQAIAAASAAVAMHTVAISTPVPTKSVEELLARSAAPSPLTTRPSQY